VNSNEGRVRLLKNQELELLTPPRILSHNGSIQNKVTTNQKPETRKACVECNLLSNYRLDACYIR
jgi:hypothetical protein